MKLTDEQMQLVKRLEQSRNNGTGLMLRDPASVGILHQLIVDLTQIKSEWISVDDRLPSEDESVFVLQDGNDVCDRLIIQASIFQGAWYADHDNGLIDFSDQLDVCRWKPIQ